MGRRPVDAVYFNSLPSTVIWWCVTTGATSVMSKCSSLSFSLSLELSRGLCSCEAACSGAVVVLGGVLFSACFAAACDSGFLAGAGVAFDCANAAPETKNESTIASTRDRISSSDRHFCFYQKAATVYINPASKPKRAHPRQC